MINWGWCKARSASQKVPSLKVESWHKKQIMNKKLKFAGIFLVTVGIIGFIIYKLLFPVDIFIMTGASMETALMNGEKVVLDRYNKEYKRMDIVVVNIPSKTKNAQLLKRIIGLPGETIEINGEKVFVNGAVLTEEYAVGVTKGDIKMILGNNQYFMMGDNREMSFDSRAFGPISIENVVGKIFYQEGREFVPRKLK